MSIVVLDHLTKVYKNGRGIKDLSMCIEKGQIVGLLGPNGSGKTTTMKIMTGLALKNLRRLFSFLVHF